MTTGRPIVVLHVIEGLGTGGSESQLAAFLFRSDTSRFRHEVCTMADVGRFAGELEKVGIPVSTIGLKPEGDLVRALARLRKVVKRVNPDIIHSSLYRPTILARVVGRLAHKSVVTTLVNTSYEPEWVLDNPRLSPRKVWLVQWVDRVTARWWGGDFVAITESVKDSACRQIGLSPEEIVVIPRGLDFDQESDGGSRDVAGVRAQLEWTGAYPIILNVARLVPQKGQRYAIRAMHQVVARFPSAHLYIAGDGPLRPTLEKLIRSEHLQDHVTLLGERRDVKVLLRAADIFVFPSLFEGLGNAVLEAMAAGRPCVVSRIPALREITGDGQVALLADLQSPEEIAANLVRVAEDSALAERLGSAAQTWVRGRYRISKSVAAHEAVYERIMMPRQAAVVAAFPDSLLPTPSTVSPRPSPLFASALTATVRALDVHRDGALRVLVYHRVCDQVGARGDPQVLSATPAAFEEQMQYVARHYVPISTQHAVAALRGETTLPRRAVLVTFDDGYRDFLTNAWPVLKRHKVPALLFIPTGLRGAARPFWWDELYEIVTRTTAPQVQLFGLGPLHLDGPQERWAAIRQLNRFLKPLAPADLSAGMQTLRDVLGTYAPTEDPILAWDELRMLVAEGLVVGSHTQTHPSLPALTETQLRSELVGAHADLQRELGGVVPVFSYPYGFADARAVPTLRELGYVAAFISLPGRNTVGKRDPFLLYRHSVDIQDSLTRLAVSLTQDSLARLAMSLTSIYPRGRTTREQRTSR